MESMAAVLILKVISGSSEDVFKESRKGCRGVEEQECEVISVYMYLRIAKEVNVINGKR